MRRIRTRTITLVARRLFFCGLLVAAAACSEQTAPPYPAGRTQFHSGTALREVENPYGPLQMWTEPSPVSLFMRKTVNSELRLAAANEVSSTAAPPPQRTGRMLAYAHTVFVELDKETLPGRVAAVQNACTESKTFACELLDVASEGERGVPSGSLRMRVAPSGVEPLIALAAKGGDATRRTTHAEDLAEPVADTERELALLNTHRDRLAEFMKSKDLKVDQLITVSKELATVQSQLGELGATRANLERRITTEILIINLTVPVAVASREQHPVRDAVRQFGSVLFEALAGVITFLAVLIPWLLVILLGLFLLRLFWRWTSRWTARREAPAKPAG